MSTPLFFGSSECVRPSLLGRLKSVHENGDDASHVPSKVTLQSWSDLGFTIVRVQALT